MEDFILGLLWAVLELLLEVLWEYVLGLIAGTIVGVFWPSGSEGEPIDFWRAVRACAGYLLVGMLVGRLTLSFFPHPFFHPSRVRGLSLVLSPVITGLLMSWTGSMLRRWEKQPAQIESFGYGFAFAFGVALLRFLFAK